MTVMVGSGGSLWSSSRPCSSASVAARARRAHVMMATDAPARAASAPVAPQLLQMHLLQEKFQSCTSSSFTMMVEVRNNGLTVEGMPVSSWLPMLPLAEDVEAESARLSFVSEQQQPRPSSTHRQLQVVLTRLVPQGSTPRLWFSSEVAAQLGLPFLNFSHVRGKEYVCPHCRTAFRAPNPLKLHLASSCDSLPPTGLWSRLVRSSSSSSSCSLGALSPWSLPFILSTAAARGSPALPLSSLAPSSSAEGGAAAPSIEAGRPYISSQPGPYTDLTHHVPAVTDTRKFISPQASVSEVLKSHLMASEQANNSRNEHRSAFRPVSSHIPLLNDHELASRNKSLTSVAYFPLPNFPMFSSLPISSVMTTNTTIGQFLNKRSSISRDILTTSSGGSSDPCADVEAIVSNLGRGRSGHICLYCGKVYSRKYGLKIHIRTHTGYKPLSCRVCHRAFGDPSNLNKHVRLHAEGATPYRCQHCGKVLVRRRDLARHLSSRHPDQPGTQLTDDDATTTDGEEDVEVEKLES